MITKAEIRKAVLSKRNAISYDEIVSRSKKITDKLKNTAEYQEARHILLYADFGHEVMTRSIFEDALSEGKKVYFPKCHEKNHMDFYQVSSIVQLQKGYRGIYEPEGIEELKFTGFGDENVLLIVPGVAFDLKGNRIGYGKGFYDAYFQRVKMATRIGLCFAEQIVEEIPFEEHDVKMDKLITDEIIYSFLRI